jgi:hypothetical protein
MNPIRMLPEAKLEPPVTYQGGKGRLARAIVANMEFGPSAHFYDLCCGSGAVAIAVVNEGLPPERVRMWDSGPWGQVWRAIGDGAFDLAVFTDYCRSVPTDPKKIKAFMEALYREPAGEHALYRYLLLQSAAIGGKSLSLVEGRWVRGSGFRDYWLPTATSSRRSPVNPMMPMPNTILARIERLVKGMRGVHGVCGDASSVKVRAGSVAYIDPPYTGTTGYDADIDAVAVARGIAAAGATCWVSEGRALTDEAVCLSTGRAKGGITGERKRAANEEWLSRFDPVGKNNHA